MPAGREAALCQVMLWLLLRLLYQPEEISVSAVPAAPRVSFQPLCLHLPALGSASSVDGQTVGITNRVSETEGHLPALGSASSVDGKTVGITNRVSETEGL